MLGALADRGITRVLLPEAPEPRVVLAAPSAARELPWVQLSPSGWTDASHLREQLESAYLYSPEGRTDRTDTTLSSDDADGEVMVEDVPEPTGATTGSPAVMMRRCWRSGQV